MEVTSQAGLLEALQAGVKLSFGPEAADWKAGLAVPGTDSQALQGWDGMAHAEQTGQNPGIPHSISLQAGVLPLRWPGTEPDCSGTQTPVSGAGHTRVWDLWAVLTHHRD